MILNNIVTDEFNAHVTSGEIEASACDIKNVKVEGTSADINMNLSGSALDYEYAIHTLSGKIEVDTMKMEHTYTTQNGSANTISIDTTSGDVKITF